MGYDNIRSNNIKLLKEKINAKFVSGSFAKVVNNQIDCLILAQDIFIYHISNIRRLTEKYENKFSEMSMLDKIIAHMGTVNIVDKRENNKMNALTDNEKIEITVAIPAEFNSAILSLRNTFDFISQIVNNAVINQYFSEEECNFGKVADYIDKNRYKLGMNIKASKDYDYMSAYCNKIKHYNLIKTPFTTNFENLGEYHNGDTLFFINEFEYKNRKYQKKNYRCFKFIRRFV